MTSTDLKHALKSLGWSQAYFADRLGVDLATVSRWANGHLPVPQYAVSYLELAMKVKVRLAVCGVNFRLLHKLFSLF